MGHISLGSVIIKVIYIMMLIIVMPIINIMTLIIISFIIMIVLITVIIYNFNIKTIDQYIILCYNKGKEGMKWMHRY